MYTIELMEPKYSSSQRELEEQKLTNAIQKGMATTILTLNS